MRNQRFSPYPLLFVGFAACDPTPIVTTPASVPPPAHVAFGLDSRPDNPTCVAPPRPPPTVPVSFVRVYENVKLQNSTVMAQIPGDGSRWFVAERMGPEGSAAPIVSFDAAHPQDEPS